MGILSEPSVCVSKSLFSAVLVWALPLYHISYRESGPDGVRSVARMIAANGLGLTYRDVLREAKPFNNTTTMLVRRVMPL